MARLLFLLPGEAVLRRVALVIHARPCSSLSITACPSLILEVLGPACASDVARSDSHGPRVQLKPRRPWHPILAASRGERPPSFCRRWHWTVDPRFDEREMCASTEVAQRRMRWWWWWWWWW
ncbi:hypothetical protein BS50DRAFT_309140 [Corynespora cassiicola Philippines]|uniref:Uncharacterized protein n=1 Tax=Corynespora cassiicola Philippines TaxID=1448308 RepID=A0A2T2NYS4_CORCC|nr:hypothetical protein BS50DRAFT_309140 [Corynespora cassiicola Philippines]